MKFKRALIFSNGSLLLSKTNYIKYDFVTILKKDSKDLKLNQKTQNKIKTKYSSNWKNTYVIYN